ncbi:MAG: hypothetical protein ACJAYU_001265 [Bradymonadia bacterium]|jgi:hypothetical protein
MNELNILEDRTLAFITHGVGEFDDVLRETIEYQRQWNQPLAKYWASRGFTPESNLHEIPGVPTDVFRHVDLVSCEAPTTKTFRTSGTTSGRRGRSPRISTRVYDASALKHAKDVFRWNTDTDFLNAVLDPRRHPDSSLSHMVDLFNHQISRRPTPYYLDEDGLDVVGLARAIREADTPVVLFGTAFALAHFAEVSDGATCLPVDSLVIETGGFKGKHSELSRPAFYDLLTTHFDVPMENIRSEYSMTELSSQLYSLPWSGEHAQLLVPPSWCRISAVDPLDLSPLPPRSAGLLRFVDLANVDTVVAVQTSDFGEVTEDGHVILHGRAPGSTPRGCGLATEEILALTERAGST